MSSARAIRQPLRYSFPTLMVAEIGAEDSDQNWYDTLFLGYAGQEPDRNVRRHVTWQPDYPCPKSPSPSCSRMAASRFFFAER